LDPIEAILENPVREDITMKRVMASQDFSSVGRLSSTKNSRQKQKRSVYVTETLHHIKPLLNYHPHSPSHIHHPSILQTSLDDTSTVTYDFDNEEIKSIKRGDLELYRPN